MKAAGVKAARAMAALMVVGVREAAQRAVEDGIHQAALAAKAAAGGVGVGLVGVGWAE